MNGFLSIFLCSFLCGYMSFLLLRRYCYHMRYLSIFNAFLPFLAGFYLDFVVFSESQYENFFLSFALALLFVMAVIDFYYFALPNVLLLLFTLLCVVGGLLLNPQENFSLEFALIPLAQGFYIMGGMYFLKFILESVRKKPMLGEADILVLGGQGMIFGLEITFLIIFLASLFTFVRFGLSAILYFLSKKQKPLSVKFPFVSYIFVATIFFMIYVPFSEGVFNV